MARTVERQACDKTKVIKKLEFDPRKLMRCVLVKHSPRLREVLGLALCEPVERGDPYFRAELKLFESCKRDG
jgi:hypothetical protein